jgi:hypothetical protein
MHANLVGCENGDVVRWRILAISAPAGKGSSPPRNHIAAEDAAGHGPTYPRELSRCRGAK